MLFNVIYVYFKIACYLRDGNDALYLLFVLIITIPKILHWESLLFVYIYICIFYSEETSSILNNETNPFFVSLGWLDKDSNCLPCHYTCKACSGPNDYQCSKCHDDAVLIEPNSLWKFLIFKKPINESYCYPDSLVPRISRAIWYYWLALACAMIVILGAVIWAASCIFSDMFKRNRPGYSPVATDINYH